jgi:GGDEF domain-containing protein
MSAAIQEREARILHQAGHDLVTGLPNRVAAEAGIQRERLRNPGAPGGAARGRAAARARNREDHGPRRRRPPDAQRGRVPDENHGRSGGTSDRHRVLGVPAGPGQVEAIASAYRLIDALSAPYQEADLSLDIEAAVGVALAPEHGLEAATLLRRAGVALLGALDTREPVVVYDPATDRTAPSACR